jgi:hypothetical protein
MAALTATTLTHTAAVSWPASPGVAAAAANGDTIPNGGETILVMNNTAGASATVTVRTTVNVDGLTAPVRTFTVPANTIQLVKLGPVSVYGSSTRVDCSATSVQLAAYAL